MPRQFFIRFLVFALLIGTVFSGVFFYSDRKSIKVRGNVQLDDEKPAIRESIAYFNKIMADIYTSGGGTARLNDFPASKPIRHIVFRDVSYIRDTGQILVLDMADMVVKEITVRSPVHAEALVYEEWNYLYQDSETRAITRPIKGMAQGYRYFLFKKDGVWGVVDYFPRDVEHEDSDDFKF